MARVVIHPPGVTLRSVVPYVGAPKLKAQRLVLAIRYHSQIGNPGLEQEVRTFDVIQRYLVKRQLVLPFFTLEEATAAVRAEHEARMAKMNLRAAEAAQTGKTFEPSA